MITNVSFLDAQEGAPVLGRLTASGSLERRQWVDLVSSPRLEAVVDSLQRGSPLDRSRCERSGPSGLDDARDRSQAALKFGLGARAQSSLLRPVAALGREAR